MKKLFLALFLMAAFALCAATAEAAQMSITRLQLGAAPNTSFIGAPFTSDLINVTIKSVFAAMTDSDDLPDGTDLRMGGVVFQGDANLYGDTSTSGFGAMFLMDLSDGNPTDGSRLTNATGTSGFFGSASSLFDQDSIDLSNNGIAAGTSVTVTIDMGGQLPHFILVQGGATTVTYTSTGNGTLEIVSSTVSITTQAEETISSAFGFFIMTDQMLDLSSSLGSTPLLFTGWSSIWVGDMDFGFPAMPDPRASSGQEGSFGSSFGASDSMIGGTFFGKSGTTASVNFWMRSDALSAIFGTSSTSDLNLQFKGDNVPTTTASKNMTVDGAPLAGTTFTGTFIFASGGGNGGLGQAVVVSAPTIDNFTPTSATSGDTVTITGTNFTGATTVSFGGTNASSFTVDSTTRITATVGSGSTGDASVTTAGGTITKSGFTYIPPIPTLSEWGFLIMITLLLGFGIYRMKRRTVSL